MYVPQNLCFEKQLDILQEPHLGNADLNKFFTSPDQVSNQNISRERNISETRKVSSLFPYWL